jgi:hypothetical protein
MQLGKNIKIFINYFLGPLLFAWLAWSIYRQIMNQPQLEASWLRIRESFSSSNIIYLALAILLIPVNWGLEALKWKFSLRYVHKIPFYAAFKAVLSGVSFSVTMPNRVGEYLGRMMYLPEGSRLKTISITLVGSWAQLLITLMTGVIGFIFLRKDLVEAFPALRIWSQFVLYGLAVLVAVLLVLFLNVSASTRLFDRWFSMKRFGYLLEALESFQQRLLLELLLLSFLRYLVFLFQYLLLFRLFEVHIDPVTAMLVMNVVFMTMAIIPSIALVEVWLRGEIIIRIMGIYNENLLGIGFTSVTIWFINLILPAVAGSLLILNLRVFKKKHEKR